MKLEDHYPNLLAKIDEEVESLRDLVVVDENYDDVDSDEFDIFEPDEYNFLVYVTERVQNAIGKEKFPQIVQKIESSALFENFYASEPDMYGVKTDLDEEGIAKKILELIEEELSC